MTEPLSWRALVLVLAMWAVLMLGFASVVEAAPPPCQKARPLTGEEPAVPCVGMLVPDADHERALRCVRERLPGCRAMLAKLSAELAIERRGRVQDRARFDRKIADYKKTARRGAGITRPAWERPAYWFTIGLVSGFALAYTTTRIADSD